MTPLQRLSKIQETLDAYSEELWQDPDVQNNLMFLLGRFIKDGTDISDEELVTLDNFLKEKVEKYVKEKGN